MNKAILISIRPEHAVHILNGEKTLELRKNLPKDFVGWVNIYVTKEKPHLYYGDLSKQYENDNYKNKWGDELNGKVVARFWFDEYTRLLPNFPSPNDYYDYFDSKLKLTREIIWRRLGLNKYDLSNYGKGKMIYAWHIKKLEIFDKPKELSDFHYYKTKTVYCGMDCPPYVDEVKHTLRKAPQSWQYVWTE